MASKGLFFCLLCAPVAAQTPINATAGESAVINCFLSLSFHPVVFWFYWQDDKQPHVLYFWKKEGKEGQRDEQYRERCQALNKTEFSSGNISIRLDNVTIGDDQKTIWANAEFLDEHTKSTTFNKVCKSTLQVVAPYQGPDLTIDETDTATCTAYGGYPAAQISWTGFDKSSKKFLVLQSTENDTKQDPADKTYNVTSTTSTKNLESVTCHVYNPQSHERLNKTKGIVAGTGQGGLPVQATALIAVAVIIIIGLVIGVFFVRKKLACKRSNGNEIAMSTRREDGAADTNDAGEQEIFLNDDGN